MKIGIMGAGNIGGTAAKLFVDAGHQVAISNSRGRDSLNDLVADLGDNAQSASVEEAVDFGDVVFIAIPFGKYKEIPPNGFEGKTTSSELLEAHLPGARIVKGFNTIYFEHLKTQGNIDLPLDQRRAIFIAGDDSEAKETVAKLVEDIGYAAIDTGFLREGGTKQQPDAPIYNKVITAGEAKAFSARA